MTQERMRAEQETAMAIEQIWSGDDDKYLRAAALSYAKGLHDGANIATSRHAGRRDFLPELDERAAQGVMV